MIPYPYPALLPAGDGEGACLIFDYMPWYYHTTAFLYHSESPPDLHMIQKSVSLLMHVPCGRNPTRGGNRLMGLLFE